MYTNIITLTDSYKMVHWQQYPKGTEGVYSYFESREGAKFPETVFFGLQALVKEHLLGSVVSRTGIEGIGGRCCSKPTLGLLGMRSGNAA